MNKTPEHFRFGFAALVGRPNVGKSTLMNQLIGQKISITSHRAQTTRHRILGISTDEDQQIVFVDTPGIHKGTKTMNKVINRTAILSTEGVDMVVLMIDSKGWQAQDKKVLDLLKGRNVPMILVINKVDMLKDKNRLLPLIAESSTLYDFTEIVPVSALKGVNTNHLFNVIGEALPIQGPGFDPDQVTDRSVRFLASELIREQLFRQLGDELPYSLGVDLISCDETEALVSIGAEIWVDKASHKPMVIGKQGARLKSVGSKARLGIELLFGKKVFLELWVKVRSGWADSQRDIQRLGYGEGL
jgi:GTP-binding protein Era